MPKQYFFQSMNIKWKALYVSKLEELVEQIIYGFIKNLLTDCNKMINVANDGHVIILVLNEC